MFFLVSIERRFTMAEKISLGKVVKVKNTNPKFGSAEFYYALKIEDYDGRNERIVLLTEKEFYGRPVFELWDKGKSLKAGRLYDLSVSFLKPQWKLVKITRPAEYKGQREEVIIAVTQKMIEEWEKRAKDNPEDLPKEKFWKNLID